MSYYINRCNSSCKHSHLLTCHAVTIVKMGWFGLDCRDKANYPIYDLDVWGNALRGGFPTGSYPYLC